MKKPLYIQSIESLITNKPRMVRNISSAGRVMTKTKTLGNRLTTSKKTHRDLWRITEICWTNWENEWSKIRRKNVTFPMSKIRISLCQMLWFMFQICHGGISVGTALRAFGLTGDQTFVFGLQFRSGNPLFHCHKFSRVDFLTALVMNIICPPRKRRILIQHSYTLF